MKKLALIAALIMSAGNIFAQNISDYDVIWDSPSKNSSGSMPIGNGELGMNIWVEPSGDILFYLSRTDAISEADRLIKLGRMRVSIGGNPLSGENFSQRLNLNDGVIEISGGKKGEECNVKLFIDPNNNVSYVLVDNKVKREIKVTSESWRKQKHKITSAESVSAWTTQPLPDTVNIYESADVFVPSSKAICWYHKNEESVYDITMIHEEKNNYRDKFPDPIKGRILGCYVASKELKSVNDSTLYSGEVKSATIEIATLSEQTPLDAWLKNIKTLEKKSNKEEALASNKKWWNDFWKRSYIYVDIPSDKALGYKISQAYALQRFMQAGSGRGNFPIKFNGSIFTVDPVYTNGAPFSADFRNWGNCFWWQNTRLPYYAMILAGDFDLMQPLFNFYLNRMDAMKTLASKYYGAKGFFIPETMTIFGTYGNGDWGWDRTGATSNDVLSGWIGKIWVQSLELSKIMLDYYHYTGDEKFLKEKAIPVITGALEYFDSRFTKNGKMDITPTQSLETYWEGVVNDMPCVAGLHYVVKEVKRLPKELLTPEFETFIDKVEKTLPALPMKGTATGNVFKPASRYVDVTSNVENPELYPLFPFGLANFSNDMGKVAKRSFERRIYDSGTGWGQDGQHTAMLGMVEPTVENLKIKINNTNPNQRFLAMWGPNYDWVPDQDHGSNLLMVLQYMVMQQYEGVSYVLPTWPKDWNVKFKLAAPKNSFVEGIYDNGKLVISPESTKQIVKIR